MRARLVETPHGVIVVVPARLAGRLAVHLERDLRRQAVEDGVRPDGPLADALAVLRRAPLAADMAAADHRASDLGSDVGESCDDPSMITTTDAARALGVTDRRVRQLIAAGAFPGARRHGATWAIPAAEVA